MGENNTFGIQAGQAAVNVGSGLVGSALGLIFANNNDWRQRQQQRKLNDIAMEDNKELAEYNYNLEMRKWNETNYAAQKEQMIKAGLNPGLMYGMSGGGGTTANTAGAQGVSAGQAPSGGGEMQAMAGMGMQNAMNLRMLEAQIKNLNAQTEKTQAETGNVPLTGENIKAQTTNTAAETVIKQAEGKIAQLEAKVAEQTITERVDALTAHYRKAEHELQILINNQTISDATYNDAIQRIQSEAIASTLEYAAKEAHITLTTQQTEESANRIAQAWKGLSIAEAAQATQAFSSEVQANYPGIFNVLGKEVNDLVNGLLQKAGAGKANERRTEKR